MTKPISPCVNKCSLDKKDICIGCLRALPEITGWSKASENERQNILNNIELRRENRCL